MAKTKQDKDSTTKPRKKDSETTSTQTKRKTNSNKQTKTKEKNKAETTPAEERITQNEYLRFGGGALIALFALFVTMSIISYTATGAQDMDYALGNSDTWSNFMGRIGAVWAYNCVANGFGYPTIFLSIFMMAAGIRIMEVVKIRLWKWFVNCGILTLWGSAMLACISMDFGIGQCPGMGGIKGAEMMEQLDQAVGSLFRYIIVFVIALAYLCYLSSETIHIIRKIIRKPVDLSQKLIKKAEEEEVPMETYVDPETGEILERPVASANEEEKPGTDANADVEVSANAEEETPEMEWEFRGGEDGPDHPKEDIDTNTATTIVFNVEGQGEQADGAQASKQLDLFDNNFEVTTGVEEEKMVKTEEPANDDPKMTVTIGDVNEEAEPDPLGALEPYDPKLDLENYRYPTLDLLKKYDIDTRSIDMQEQQKNKEQIITALRNFGVEISSIKATVGPTITLYEITPAPGVRISKIRNLEDDIALSLSALGIRIIAPIPGKGTVGIEVPNAKPQIVSMESVINSKKFQECDYELPMALGKTITNEIFMADLAKMPHLLVAGATGQGKSVGLNAILTSLLYKKHPAELKLVMVDPKKVEFSVYNPLVKHFLAQVEGNEDMEEPIITDVNKVIQTLKSLCQEMDTRYDLLKKARARNLREYNEKFKSRQLNPHNGHKFMPYIVVIIDEFGDLIMTAGKEVELPIARIAQLARAVGIHMIIATQRPTTNIITGTIKANFPARIAFKVSAMIDSRTILDRPGANQLVGKGDMLFLAGNEPIRVQCAFVDTPEVERINNFIAEQQSYLGPFPLPYVEMEGDSGDAPDVDLNHLDPMFDEVARLIVSTQQGSTSMIQRKFSIGYNRAGRLMDQMEVAGIVGPAHGSKPREVLCQTESELQYKLDNLR